MSKRLPEEYKKYTYKKIDNLLLKEKEYIFHAGTKLEHKKILSSGGRVLNFVSISKDIKKSREDLIKLINDLKWENGFFRKDIGYKVID